MKPTTKSIIELHLTTILWSVTPLFAKLIPLPAYAIICLRCVFTAITLAFFIWFTKDSLRLPSKKSIGLMGLLGLIMCVHWVTLFHGIQTSTVPIAIIAFFSFPVMSGLIEPFFSHDSWDARELFSACLIVIGIYFIVPEFSLSNQYTIGVLWVIFSAFLFAVRNIIIRKYAGNYSGSVIMFYQMVITASLLLPFVTAHIPVVDGSSWWKLLLMSVVFTAIPHTLLAKSLKTIKASTAGIIISLQPLYTTCFSIWILGEYPTAYVWLGGTIVGAAVLFETYRQHAKT